MSVTVHQRVLDAGVAVVLFACVALFVGYDALGAYGPHAAVGVSWLAFFIATMGLLWHRPPRNTGWRDGAIAILMGSITDTVLIVVGRPGDYRWLPIQIGYALCYFFGLRAVMKMGRHWSRQWKAAAVLDTATLTAALVTLLVSVAYPGLTSSAVSSSFQAVAITFPILDAIILTVLIRVWLAQRARVSAVQLGSVAPLFLVIYHTVVLLELSHPGNIHPRWNETWVLMFVALAIAMTRPSMRNASLDTPGPASDSLRAELATIAASLSIPYLLILGYSSAGAQVPWPPVVVGGLIITVLVITRILLLLRVAQERAVQGEQLAVVDALTGAPNRRRWDQALGNAVAEVEADGSAAGFWVALLDLDYFKRFNDDYGHQAGDELLRRCVEAWSAQLGPKDLLTRYGGEEFAVLLSPRDDLAAADLLDRLRRSTPLGQTCSIGAVQAQVGDAAEELVRSADQALYRAKRGGRDRLVLAPPVPVVRRDP